MTDIRRHPPKAAPRLPLLSRGYLFCPLRGWRVYGERPEPYPHLWGAALDHPSPASRCGEELQTAEAEMGSREEAETESGGQGGAVSALEAPLVSPASPSWETSRGASPLNHPIPSLGPSEEPQA